MDGKQEEPVLTVIWGLSKDYGALTGTEGLSVIFRRQFESSAGQTGHLYFLVGRSLTALLFLLLQGHDTVFQGVEVTDTARSVWLSGESVSVRWTKGFSTRL